MSLSFSGLRENSRHTPDDDDHDLLMPWSLWKSHTQSLSSCMRRLDLFFNGLSSPSYSLLPLEQRQRKDVSHRKRAEGDDEDDDANSSGGNNHLAARKGTTSLSTTSGSRHEKCVAPATLVPLSSPNDSPSHVMTWKKGREKWLHLHSKDRKGLSCSPLQSERKKERL